MPFGDQVFIFTFLGFALAALEQRTRAARVTRRVIRAHAKDVRRGRVSFPVVVVLALLTLASWLAWSIVVISASHSQNPHEGSVRDMDWTPPVAAELAHERRDQ